MCGNVQIEAQRKALGALKAACNSEPGIECAAVCQAHLPLLPHGSQALLGIDGSHCLGGLKGTLVCMLRATPSPGLTALEPLLYSDTTTIF